jgi:hypothetical protein
MGASIVQDHSVTHHRSQLVAIAVLVLGMVRQRGPT